MLELFEEHPFLTTAAIVFVIILVLVIGRSDPFLGEILGSERGFPILTFGAGAVLLAILAIGKAVILPKDSKKRKRRARALKASNSNK